MRIPIFCDAHVRISKSAQEKKYTKSQIVQDYKVLYTKSLSIDGLYYTNKSVKQTVKKINQRTSGGRQKIL